MVLRQTYSHPICNPVILIRKVRIPINTPQDLYVQHVRKYEFVLLGYIQLENGIRKYFLLRHTCPRRKYDMKIQCLCFREIIIRLNSIIALVGSMGVTNKIVLLFSLSFLPTSVIAIDGVRFLHLFLFLFFFYPHSSL